MIKSAIRDLFTLHSIQTEKPVVLGVSGGADSMCLLDSLARLEYRVIVAHFNHQIRTEAANDAQFVRQMASRYGCNFVEGHSDVPKFADKNKKSMEEAARILRYQFLFEQCRDLGAQCVIVAHNADDQVETVLMNLVRGSGLDGLGGMRAVQLPNPWSNEYPLVRPILGIWREDIESYIEENDIPYVEDVTNRDVKYYRNRIRHELLPLLGGYNPAIKKNLLKLSQIASTDSDYLKRIVHAASVDLVQDTEAGVILETDRFLDLDESIQRRLLISIFDRIVDSQQAYDFAGVERVRNAISVKKAGTQIDAGGGVTVFVENDMIRFQERDQILVFQDYPQIETEKDLFAHGDHKLSSDWIIRITEISNSDRIRMDIKENMDPFTVYIGISKNKRIHLRNRRPGDRITPLGMPGQTIKLSDLMINQKIPKLARANWPVVEIGGEIAWVPGLKVSHSFRVRDGTDKIVQIRCYREK